MNERIKITGYVGKVTTGQHNELPFIRFSIGANVDGAVESQTHWYSVTLWGSRKVNTYSAKVRKGDIISVSGTPEIKMYTKDNEKRVSVMIRMGAADRIKIIRHAKGKAESVNEGGD